MFDINMRHNIQHAHTHTHTHTMQSHDRVAESAEMHTVLTAKDCTRFATEVNSDKVVVPTEIKLSDHPKWNVYENNHFAMRRRLVSIFLKVNL